MKKALNSTIVALALQGLVCGMATAQSTWGELADKGGKALNAEETKQVLSGAKMAGQTAPGQTYEWQFNADGSLNGWVANERGRVQIIGTWKVDERNLFCWEYVLTKINTRSSGCTRLMQGGNEYFVGVGGTGREAKIQKREIVR